MPDRSIVVKLRGDISDLKAKLGSAKSEIASVAQASEQASKKTTATTLSAAQADKVRAGARTAALAQEIRAQEQAAAAVQKYGRSTAFVSNHASDISTLGSGFLKLGVAAAAGVGVSVAAFANFDEAISHVSATGQDARGSIDALRKAAIQAGADTKYSATEAAAGEEALLKAGVSAQEVLSGGLSGALNLAASGNLDVASSAEVAASAMTQFGLSGKDVPHIADLLAAGAGKAQGEVSDMGAALNQAGLVASGFGLSIEETVGSLAAFASAGLVGSDSGTAFKTMIQRLQNPTDDAAATMKQLGLNVYDAQGQFVGMANFAEQLKTRLSGLTDEQRNAGLATIFGADAIRGANVLYKEGGQGITDWTNKVNDAGFASEQAAARMDNLKGDVEQLKGSIETGLIQSGSGANDFLRSLAQGATDAANGFGKLPAGVQQGALGVASLVAVAGLGVGAFSKLAVGAAETKTALANLSGTAAGTAIGKLGAAATITTAALIGLNAAGALVDKVAGSGARSLGDAGQAIAGFGTDVDAGSKSLDSFFTLSTTKDLNPFQGQVDGLSGAFARLNEVGGGKVFDALNHGIAVLGGAKGSLDITKDRFAQLDQVLSQTASSSGPEATAAFSQIAKSAADQKVPVEELVALFPEYKKQLQDQATALGVTVPDSAQTFADWMGGKVPDAISAAAKANPKLAAQLDLTGKGLQKTQVSAEDAVKDLYTYASAMDAISSSAGGAEEAIDAANASIKGDTHDQGTKQGRSNQAALDNVGSKSRDSLSALSIGGASQAALDSAAAHYRKKYREIAEDIGYSGKAARAFADDLIATPKAVNVRVVTAGAKVSADQAAVLNHELKSIPKEQRARIVTIAETKGAKAAQTAIERVKDKKVIARADGNPKGAKAVKSAMDALRDRLVKATARGDKKGAADVKAAMDRLKNRSVTAGTKGNTQGATKVNQAMKNLDDRTVTARANAEGTGGVNSLKSAINGLQSKTVTVTYETRKRGNADGGYIDSTFPGYDGGGQVQGNGGPREDNVAGIDRNSGVQTSWVSVGEMVTNARSTANNFGVLSMINANPDKKYGLVELSDGGALSLPRYAKGSTNGDVANVVRLQQNVDNARNLAELARALKAQEKATKSLTSAEQASSEAVKSLSSSFREAYTSKTNDPKDLLDQMQQGAADLSLFAADIKKLTGLGLSKGVIDQITAKGAAGGGLDLAQAIIDGGKSLVDSLNKANAGLDLAANNVGLAANGVPIKKAYGGPIWGGRGARADDINVAASGGEFMVQEPIARSNMGFLQQFNAGRQVLPSYARTTMAAVTSSVDSSYHEGSTTLHGVGPDVERALARERQRKRDAYNLRGLSRARS